MIGSGIFIVSAEAARNVPSPLALLLVWLLTLAVTVAGAWSYGRLAVAFPQAGGQYVYLREAWGDLGGFLYGWAVLLVIQTGTIAAVGVAFGKYLGVLVPAVHAEPWVRLGFLRVSPVELVGVLLIALLTWWNTTSLRRGAVRAERLHGGQGPGPAGPAPRLPPAGGRLFSSEMSWGLDAARLPLAAPLLWAFAAAAVQPLFAADAWNNVTFLSEEVRDPERNVPKALLLGTTVVCGLYFLTNVGYLNALPVGAHRLGPAGPGGHRGGGGHRPRGRGREDHGRDHPRLGLRLPERPHPGRRARPLRHVARRAVPSRLRPPERRAHPAERPRGPGRVGLAARALGPLRRPPRLPDDRGAGLLRAHHRGPAGDWPGAGPSCARAASPSAWCPSSTWRSWSTSASASPW